MRMSDTEEHEKGKPIFYHKREQGLQILNWLYERTYLGKQLRK
jgi:hypothetical protein